MYLVSIYEAVELGLKGGIRHIGSDVIFGD
jgi:hypothetical protein